MKIYFAGSIRGGRDDKELYFKIIEILSKYGEVLTEHVGDKNVSHVGEDGLNDKYIYDRDMKWLEQADVVIAEVTTPSLGVGYEVAKAEKDKKTLCIYRSKKNKHLSAMIGGNDSIVLREYQTLEDLEKTFNEFFTQ
jgi:2'-deoxynucleoside 5'-phosphate N-hydrolase